MEYKKVLDSKIMKKETITSKDGRSFSLIELSYPGFSCRPGQFVMIQTPDDGFQWAYPYMIYSSAADSFSVLAPTNSSLSDRDTGSKQVVWGANGTGITDKVPSLMIAEPATFFLIAPLCHSFPDQELVILGEEASVPAALCPKKTLYVKNTEELALKMEQAETIYLALNIGTLEALMNDQTASVKDKSYVFVSTQIGCGIGACRACYLHSPDLQSGIPVCCNGPYMAYQRIDFETDRNCFLTY